MGKNKTDIHNEIKVRLRRMENFGRSKSDFKKSGEYKNFIFSYNTAKEYNRECQKFAEYVKKHSPKGRYTTIEEAKDLAIQYIKEENENPKKSANTVHKERSALAKLYGVEGKELGEIKARRRADITRSRNRYVTSEKTGKQILNPHKRAGHFSEKNHADEVVFAKGTGMRRSEMEKVRGDQLIKNSDGTYSFRLEGWQCKGGRERILPVIGDVERIVAAANNAGKDKIWGKLPDAMDVHHYRSQYATELYKSLARDVKKIPKKEVYCCRGELKGTWYDKNAMDKVSKALGHNRRCVIAENYLR